MLVSEAKREVAIQHRAHSRFVLRTLLKLRWCAGGWFAREPAGWKPSSKAHDRNASDRPPTIPRTLCNTTPAQPDPGKCWLRTSARAVPRNQALAPVSHVTPLCVRSERRLVDLDGDGVTNAIRSALALSATSTTQPRRWNDTRRVERQSLDVFPTLIFPIPGSIGGSNEPKTVRKGFVCNESDWTGGQRYSSQPRPTSR